MIFNNIPKILEDIGLTKNEIKVYLALNEIRESTISPIVNKAGISNSKIYIILEKLIKKGLVSCIMINNVRNYKTAHLSRLIDFIEEKKAKLDEEKNLIEKIIPQLISAQSESFRGAEVEVFQGFEGLKTVRERALRLMKKDDELLILGASKFSTSKYEFYWENYHKRRIIKKIKCRYLMYEETKKEEGKKRESWRLTKVRYMKNTPKNPVRIDIYKEFTDIAIDAINPFVISIKSKEISESFKSYFEELWHLAKK